MLKSDSKYDFEGIYREVAEAYEGCSEAEILEEIAAQYLSVAFSSANNIRKIVDEASAEETSFLKKLVTRLKEFLNEIRQKMKLYAGTDKTVRAAVETPVEQLDYIADMFMTALNEVGKTKKPTESDGGVKASIKKTRTMSYSKQVEKAENGTLARSDALFIGDATANLLSIGLSDKPLAMHQGDYRKSRRESANNKNYSRHGIKLKTFKKLPVLIEEAVMFVDNNDKLTIITNELMSDTKGQPSYVIVGIHKDMKMDNDDIHQPKSVYPLDDFVELIKKYAENGQFVITDKNKADELLTRVGIQPSERSRIISLAKSTISQNETDVKEKSSTKYSYAGVKAKTADVKTLEYAIRLEDVGKSTAEEIRQQTGWFRGYDNKWRFEISDRDIVIDTRGLFSSNPDIRRYTQLVDKAYINMTATEEEMQELLTLDKNLEGVSLAPKTLGELIHHPTLFEAYPQLKDIKIYFDDIEARGAYNPVFKEISISKNLKLDKTKLTKTLVHEIQHAIQDIEGFTNGSSKSYWEAVYKEDYESLRNMRNNLDMWLKDIGFTEYVNESMKQVVSKEKTLAQHWDDIESFKKNSRYAREIENCEKAIAEFESRLPSPAELYERTAGEIEARDATLRHWRSDEARKESRPDIDRTDVVFAEGEVLSFDIKTDTDGNKFVDVNPDLFDARDGESHASTIARIIKDRFNNLISVNGQRIQINKTTNDEWRRSKSANSFLKKDPQLYDDKLKTIANADEIIVAARNWIGEEPSHIRKDDIVEFARGNVYYRVGNNGYAADVIVAIRNNGTSVLYDLRNIYSKKITDASVTMASESPQRSAETSVTDNVTQSAVDVKTKYSRQRLGDAWEDIRAKMYENQVHEDIINEVEEHIGKLRRANITREEEVTGGLIPKYEALLKLAREHTKGSDVKATELADTLNDLVWAAHDGNLDTKQFISTVRVIAEEIISTGKVLNDDMP